LLIETGPRQFLAVECKVAAEVEKRSLKGFTLLREVYGAKALKKGAVVCRTERPYPLAEKNLITSLPLGGPEGLFNWIKSMVSF
jgi:hypothetical protein